MRMIEHHRCLRGVQEGSAPGHLRDAAGRSTRSRSVELYCIRQHYVEVAAGRGAAIGDLLGSNPSLETERFLLLLLSASFSIFLRLILMVKQPVGAAPTAPSLSPVLCFHQAAP